MSVYVINRTDERILIAVDTAIANEKCESQAAKVVPFPHAGLVLAFRGKHIYGATVALVVQTLAVEGIVDFDAFMSRPIAILNEARRVLGDQPQIHVDEAEVVVAGWSQRQARMQAFVFSLATGSAEWTAHRVDTWRLNGGDLASPPPVLPADTVESVRDAARWCANGLVAKGVTAGGQIVVTELRRDRIVMDTFGPSCGA